MTASTANTTCSFDRYGSYGFASPYFLGVFSYFAVYGIAMSVKSMLPKSVASLLLGLFIGYPRDHDSAGEFLKKFEPHLCHLFKYLMGILENKNSKNSHDDKYSKVPLNPTGMNDLLKNHRRSPGTDVLMRDSLEKVKHSIDPIRDTAMGDLLSHILKDIVTDDNRFKFLSDGAEGDADAIAMPPLMQFPVAPSMPPSVPVEPPSPSVSSVEVDETVTESESVPRGFGIYGDALGTVGDALGTVGEVRHDMELD